MVGKSSILDKLSFVFKNRPPVTKRITYKVSDNEEAVAIQNPATRKILAIHRVREDETLDVIAQRYYGSEIHDYWVVIYEYNKAIIGSNPGIIRPGTELKIPELPGSLTMKKRGRYGYEPD